MKTIKYITGVECVSMKHPTYWSPEWLTQKMLIVIIIIIIIILTYSMVQSPWEANWFAASQEIPRISRNPKVHYRTHKPPPPVSILGQPNPVHIPTSHLLEIHPNIIHLCTPRSPQWSPSLWFPQQNPIHPHLLTHTNNNNNNNTLLLMCWQNIHKAS